MSLWSRRWGSPVLAGAALALSSLASAATFTVTNTADSGSGSLRQAILDANAAAGADVIDFNIPGAGPHTILTGSTLLVSGTTRIDARTQPGYAGNPLIEILATVPNTIAFGIQLAAPSCEVYGLAVGLFQNGIYSTGQINQTIKSCYAGVRADGISLAPNRDRGIYLFNSSGSRVGGPGEGNVVSGNTTVGLAITVGNNYTIQANRFGPDPSGMIKLGNDRGVELSSVTDSWFGGLFVGEGNHVGANNRTGLWMSGCARVQISNNLLGPKADGVSRFPFSIYVSIGQQFGTQMFSCTDIQFGQPGTHGGNTLGDSGQVIAAQSCTRLVIQNNKFGSDPTGMFFTGGNNMAQIDLSFDTKIGGSNPGEGNLFPFTSSTGVNFFRSQRSIVRGNVFGLKADGTKATPNNLAVVFQFSDDGIVGGPNPGDGNLFAGLDGSAINLRTAQRTVIQGNRFGVDPTGTAVRTIRESGILMESSHDTIIGGFNPGEANWIGSCGQWAISIAAAGSTHACNRTQILGNRIGVGSSDGAPSFPNTRGGVFVNFGVSNRISRNNIAFNIAGSGHLGLGINLDGAAVNANDIGDVDTGPNNLQNFPDISTVTVTGAGTRVQGSLSSSPSTTYVLEFFSNDAGDSTGFGEGEYILGSTSVVTDPTGFASFDITFPTSMPITRKISSTATDPTGNTSEFSAWASVTTNQAPVADAGADQVVTVPHDGDPNTDTVDITLDGRLSSDPDDDTLTFVWSENGNVKGTDPLITVPQTAGTYVFDLVVQDPSGETSTDSVQVIVQPEANAAPEANAGNDQTVVIQHDGDPDTSTVNVILSGSGSDGDGDTLTYEWRDGNGVVVGTSATLTQTLTEGSHTFTLKVVDGYGAGGTDQVTITVEPEPNAAPTASSGAGQTLPVPYDGSPATTDATFTLSGTGNDPDGDTLAYEWSDASGVIGTTASLSVSRPEGTHAFTLKVTDPYGLASTSSVVVTVMPENRPPVAGPGDGVTVEVPHDGNPSTDTAAFNLSATGVQDPENDTLTYEWREGATVVGSSASFSSSKPEGMYTYTLTVTDPFGESSSSIYMVTVLPEPNATPTVDAGPNQAVPATPTGATVNVSAVGFDADGDGMAYVWFWNGSQVATGANASINLPAGLHTLTVEVTDPYGARSTDTVTVGVHYLWGGFLAPINNDGSSIFKLGSTIPVKFQLTGVSAGSIVTAKLYIAKVSNGIVGTELEPETNVAGDWGNTFRFEDGLFQFNLSTKVTNGLSTGTWQLRVDLGDGYPPRTVLISLK